MPRSGRRSSGRSSWSTLPDEAEASRSRTPPGTASRRASGRRTSDGPCAWGAIDTGFLWINTINSHPIEAPFGGVKDSGFGREEGLQALENYRVQRSLIVGGERFVDPYAADD